jgi:hypothetical protein
MRSSSTLSPTTLAMAFVAGLLAVPIFHQGLFQIFHVAGIIPVPAFDMSPTKPLGVPAVVSASLWGGVWGIVLALVVPRLFHGVSYWVASIVFGAVALTAVYAFVVVPIKTGAVPSNLGQIAVIGGLLNGAWGFGTALFLRALTRRGTAGAGSMRRA